MSATAAPDLVTTALSEAAAASRDGRIVEQHFSEAQWARAPFPKAFRPRAYTYGNCTIFVGREPMPAPYEEVRWHLSIAHPWRLPCWDEIKHVRAELLPADVHFCQPMPQAKYWINVHQYCLHLWEICDPALTAQWESEVAA